MTESRLKDEQAFAHIAENIKRITYRVDEAKVKAGRENDTVRIMAVTKTVPPEAVNFVVSQGIGLLGENRVQELLSKYEAYDPSAELQFIGHLQTNKVKYIADKVTMIQSVDSLKLAEEIDARAGALGKRMDVLVELNIGEEESKSGVLPDRLEELLHEASVLPHIHVRGLMAIPPAGRGAKFFPGIERIFIDMRSKKIDNVTMEFLSMGMSDDFAEAVLNGANMIRIGTLLFGSRK